MRRAKMTRFILIAILGLCSTTDTVFAVSEQFNVKDVQELDRLFLNGYWDVDNPGQMPATPDSFLKSYCNFTTMLNESLKIMNLVEKMFADNPLLLAFHRVNEMINLHETTRCCKNAEVIREIADANMKMNKIIAQFALMNGVAINTYLTVAEPHSELGAGDLLCLGKKLTNYQQESLPKGLEKSMLNILAQIQSIHSRLVKVILRDMNVDLSGKDCHLVHLPVPNPLGIQSQELASLMAWNKVLKQLPSNQPPVLNHHSRDRAINIKVVPGKPYQVDKMTLIVNVNKGHLSKHGDYKK